MELVREGFKTPFWMASTTSTSAFLKLSFVGPQHTGNYSCRYTALSPFTFESGISDPVEVVVEGKALLSCVWVVALNISRAVHWLIA